MRHAIERSCSRHKARRLSIAVNQEYALLQLSSTFSSKPRHYSTAYFNSRAPQKVGSVNQFKNSIYIGIMSAPKNIARRMAVRSAYLNQLRNESRDGRLAFGIRAEFIMGHTPFETSFQGSVASPQQMQLEREIQAEALEHGDIARIPLPERYENLPDKVLQMLTRGLQTRYDFILKIDDDQHLDIAALETLLEAVDPQSLLYAGGYLWKSEEFSSQEGADHKFVKYYGGPCYLLSEKLASRIAIDMQNQTSAFTAYGSSSEDVDMGRWVNMAPHLSEHVTFLDVQISKGLF